MVKSNLVKRQGAKLWGKAIYGYNCQVTIKQRKNLYQAFPQQRWKHSRNACEGG
jgi:hypothetical protein